MYAVLLTIEIIVCIALIGVILLQRSEGGGLGLGGGGGMSGLMTGRGAANALTRTTVILATLFIGLAVALALMARYSAAPTSPLGGAAETPAPLGTLPDFSSPPAVPTPAAPSAPSVPVPAAPADGATQPAAPAPAAPAATAPAAAPAAGNPQPAPTAPAGGGGN